MPSTQAPRDKSRGPSGLKVEAARHAIHVENLAREVKASNHTALHRGEVDLAQGDAAAGDEFLFERGFAAHLIDVVEQGVEELVLGLLAEVQPHGIGGNLRPLEQVRPKLLGQLKRARVGDLLFPHLVDGCVHRCGGFGGVGDADPVDLDRERVAAFGEVAGAPRAELQHGRTAHAPVGDQHWTILHKLGSLDAHKGVGHHHAHQRGDIFARHVEREQGRNGVAHRVTERFEPGQPRPLGAAASGHDHVVEGLPVEVEPAAGLGFELLDRRLKSDVHAFAVGFAKEAVDDGLGRVRGGEHAPVVLGFEGDAPGLEPRDRVGRLKRAEALFQLLAAARVVLGQGRGGEAVVGDVAASAAGDFDLGQEFGRLLEKHNLGRRMVLSCRQRGEKSRGTSANHRHLRCTFHARKLAYKARGRVS